MAVKNDIGLNWKFHMGDDPQAEYMGYDDSAWRTVTVPHDWSVEQPFDRKYSSGAGYLQGGTAWYRKHIELPDGVRGKRIRLTFDGVYKHAQVWVNSNYMGRHAYGYTAFSYDVSSFMHEGENVIAVRVEHEETADSRWFTGSGIYRNVYIEISDPVSFTENGIFVYTEKLAGNTAVMNVRYDTYGADRVRFILKDHEENEITETWMAEGSGTADIIFTGPRLWSPEDPYLYKLTAEAYFDGELRDTVTLKTGVRQFRFDADKGFFLNGKNMKIKGVCVHHDGGALGAAVPRCVWEKRLIKLKDMGCNAIRTAHNPPSDVLLDLLDELGFLCMDEAFDEWEGTKNKWWQGHNVYPPKRFGYAEDFHEWHEKDLASMVLRDRNHPSVILWSIGNEIDYPNDPYVSPLFKEVFGNNDANKPAQERQYDPRKPDASRLPVIAAELTDIVHSLDHTRPVTSALSFPELSTKTGYAQVLDVAGYNYKEGFYDAHHKEFPSQIMIGSENSHSPEAWHAVTDREFISGQFDWTGVDFLGECRGWPLRISEAGLLDLAGNEKPVYYLKKAMWDSEPFVKITFRKDEDDRKGTLLFKGKTGDFMQAVCYTNQESVRLYVNNDLIGEKLAGRENGYAAVFEVPYTDGIIRAEAGDTQDAVMSCGKASVIEMMPGSNHIKADGHDTVMIEVRVLDENGIPVSIDDEISYQILGDAEIIGIENGIPDDLTPYSEKKRRTKDGRAVLYIRAGTAPCEIGVYAVNKERTLNGFAGLISTPDHLLGK